MNKRVFMVVAVVLLLGLFFNIHKLGQKIEVIKAKNDIVDRIVDRVDKLITNDNHLFWYINFEEACRFSQEHNLPILLLFTAPDSCVYCKKLEDEILFKEEFKVWAKENVVLFVANFSDQKNKDLLVQNYFLVEKFKINSYPSTVILSYSEKENKLFGLQSVTGYGKNWFEVIKTTVEKLK